MEADFERVVLFFGRIVSRTERVVIVFEALNDSLSESFNDMGDSFDGLKDSLHSLRASIVPLGES